MASAAAAPTLLTLLLLLTATACTAKFTCSQTPRATCRALADYIPVNDTSFAAIQSLFGVKKLYDLLGANDIPISLSSASDRNISVKSGQRVKIPFTCACRRGTGVSAGGPVYAVKSGDTLDGIAREVFGGLATFQEIAAASGVKNVDLIVVGQNLTVPIPCSCDTVDGLVVVHYGHVVATGSTLKSIAAAHGTTEDTLLRLNNMANSSELMAAQLLDVPLKACSSPMKNSSLESSLVVPNGTYVVTAQQCVTCRCDASNNLTLQCVPSQLKPIQWSSCPSTQCDDSNLGIGNFTKTSGGCQACSYAGYDNTTIFTALNQQSTCPGQTNNNTGQTNNNTGQTNNGVSKMGMQVWSWNLFLTPFLGVLLAFALF